MLRTRHGYYVSVSLLARTAKFVVLVVLSVSLAWQIGGLL